MSHYLLSGVPDLVRWMVAFLKQMGDLPLSTLQCPLHPVLLQWDAKDPGHSAKHTGTLDPTKSD